MENNIITILLTLLVIFIGIVSQKKKKVPGTTESGEESIPKDVLSDPFPTQRQPSPEETIRKLLGEVTSVPEKEEPAPSPAVASDETGSDLEEPQGLRKEREAYMAAEGISVTSAPPLSIISLMEEEEEEDNDILLHEIGHEASNDLSEKIFIPFLEEFDIRKAVIYSEIINRKEHI